MRAPLAQLARPPTKRPAQEGAQVQGEYDCWQELQCVTCTATPAAELVQRAYTAQHAGPSVLPPPRNTTGTISQLVFMMTGMACDCQGAQLAQSPGTLQNAAEAGEHEGQQPTVRCRDIQPAALQMGSPLYTA